MIALIVTAGLLGFVYSAAPGAANTEALRRGLQRRFAPLSLPLAMAYFALEMLWNIIHSTILPMFSSRSTRSE